MPVPDIHWIHQIPLPDGTTTPGVSRPAIDDFGLPDVDVRGKRVLDVGCLDGLYSFYAESKGAAEVVSIDILEEQFGPQGARYNTASGYLWAHERLGSRAKYIFPFSVYDVPELGEFDVVYCMGVIYHLAHPLLAIERINRALRMNGMLVLETEVSATSSLFCHRMRHTGNVATAQRVGLLQGIARFAKLFATRPGSALRFLPFGLKRLRDAIGLRTNRDFYAVDPTVIVVPGIESLERMIDFAGFRIERAIARAARMAYHCRKVAEVNPVFAGGGVRAGMTRITNVD
jgi:SAM-dependent methyltransferase